MQEALRRARAKVRRERLGFGLSSVCLAVNFVRVAINCRTVLPGFWGRFPSIPAAVSLKPVYETVTYRCHDQHPGVHS